MIIYLKAIYNTKLFVKAWDYLCGIGELIKIVMTIDLCDLYEKHLHLSPIISIIYASGWIIITSHQNITIWLQFSCMPNHHTKYPIRDLTKDLMMCPSRGIDAFQNHTALNCSKLHGKKAISWTRIRTLFIWQGQVYNTYSNKCVIVAFIQVNYRDCS